MLSRIYMLDKSVAEDSLFDKNLEDDFSLTPVCQDLALIVIVF
ncbi:MAG: hypothetical protein AB4041_22340 [Microcystaceae cyanobacterium]